jgi:NAD(P)-dependent dehydrogenase (short-subunit alcohol dehydrogenase family)
MASVQPSSPARNALVTGAARRIGRTLAEALASEGWRVVVHYHGSLDAADNVVAAIRSKGGDAVAVEADLSNIAATQNLIPRATKLVGPLSCLINNASIFEPDDLRTATPASWSSHIDINLRAPFFLSQAFARQLPTAIPGNIINIIDERVWHLTPHFASYTASKAGLWALTQTLAMALAPAIRVNAVGPGPTLPSPRQTEAQFDALSRSMPLQRGTSPQEIAAAVRFILAAPAMTGQMIALDGGQHLGWGQVPNDTPPSD